MIPVMVLALGMTQQQAHGTSLAVMIPPVALPAVLRYWKDGNVDWWMALWVAVGVLLGTWPGAEIANRLHGSNKDALKWVFGFTLIYVAAYTVFGKQHMARTLTMAGLLVAIAVGMLIFTKWQDGKSGETAQTRVDIAQVQK